MKKFACIIGAIVFGITMVSATSFAESYNWKMISFLSAGKNFNQEIKQFAEIVKEKTNGKVNFTIYEGTFGAPPDAWEMTKNNVVQFTYTANSFNSNRLPVVNLVDLPFEFPDPMSVKLVIDAWEKAGYLKEVTDNFKLLWLMPTSPLHAFFSKKSVLSLEDWKSVKVRVPSSAQAQIINALGGSAVSMPGSEVYMALSTGVVDGQVQSIESIHDRKLYEVTKYAIKSPPICFGMLMFMMNKKLWNSLPVDMQNVIDQAAKQVADEAIDRTQNGLGPVWDSVAPQMKEIDNIPKSEVARWRKATESIAKNYIQEKNSNNFPVRKAYELAQKVINDYQMQQ